jgi:hypothetical protein
MADAEGPEKVRLVVGVRGSGKCWMLGWDTNERTRRAWDYGDTVFEDCLSFGDGW